MSYPTGPPTKDDLGPVETCYTMVFFADKSISVHLKLQKALKAGLALPSWLVQEARKQYREGRLQKPWLRYHVTPYFYDPRMIPLPGHPEWEFNPSYPREYPRLIKKRVKVLHDGTVRKEKRSMRRWRLMKFWEKKAKRGTHFSKLLMKKKEMRRKRSQKTKKKARTDKPQSAVQMKVNDRVYHVPEEYSQDEDVQVVFDAHEPVYQASRLQLPTYYDFMTANSHDPQIKANGVHEYLKMWFENGRKFIPEAVQEVLCFQEWFYLPKVDERDPWLVKRHRYRRSRVKKRHDAWEKEEKLKDTGSRFRRNIGREQILRWARDCEEWKKEMERVIVRVRGTGDCLLYTEMVEANWQEFIERAWKRHQWNSVSRHDKEIFQANGESLLPIVAKMNEAFHFREELRQCKECIDDMIQMVSCQEIIPQLVTVKEVAREQLWDKPTTAPELEYLHPENERDLIDELKEISTIRERKASISKIFWNMFALLKVDDCYWTVPLNSFVDMHKSETTVPESGVLRKFKPDLRCPIEVFKVFLTTNMDTNGRTKTGSDEFEYNTLPEIRKLYHEELARKEKMLKDSRSRTYYSGVLQKNVHNPYRSFHTKKRIDRYVLKQNLQKFVKPSVGYSWRIKPFSMFNLPLTRKEEKTLECERKTRIEDAEVARKKKDVEQSKNEYLRERNGPLQLSDILKFPVRKYPMIRIPYEKEKKPSMADTKYVLYMLDRLDAKVFASGSEKQEERNKLMKMADRAKFDELMAARMEKGRIERLTRIGPLERKERALGLKDDPGASTSNFETSRHLTHFYSMAGMEKPRDVEWELLMEYEKEQKEAKENEKRKTRKQAQAAKRRHLKKNTETSVHNATVMQDEVPESLNDQDIVEEEAGEFDNVNDVERQMLEHDYELLSEDYFEKERLRGSVSSDDDQRTSVAKTNTSEENQEDTEVVTEAQNGNTPVYYDEIAGLFDELAQDAQSSDTDLDDSEDENVERDNMPVQEHHDSAHETRQELPEEQRRLVSPVSEGMPNDSPQNDKDAADRTENAPEQSEQRDSPEPRHDKHENSDNAGGAVSEGAAQQESTSSKKHIEVVTLDDDDDDDDCVVLQAKIVKQEVDVKKEVDDEEAKAREESERRRRQEDQDIEIERQLMNKERQLIELEREKLKREFEKLGKEKQSEKRTRWKPFLVSRDDPNYFAKYKAYIDEMCPDNYDEDVCSDDEPQSSNALLERSSNRGENVGEEQDLDVQILSERRPEDSPSRSVDIPMGSPVESRYSAQPMPEQFITNGERYGRNTLNADLDKVKEEPTSPRSSSPLRVDTNETIEEREQTKSITPDPAAVKAEPISPARSPSLMISEMRTESPPADDHYSPTTFEQVSATIIIKRAIHIDSDGSSERSGFSEPVSSPVQVTENDECELREVKQEAESPARSPVPDAAQLIEHEVESDNEYATNISHARDGSSEPEIIEPSESENEEEEYVHPYVKAILAGEWSTPSPVPNIYADDPNEPHWLWDFPEEIDESEKQQEEQVASRISSVQPEDAVEQENRVIKEEPASRSVSPICAPSGKTISMANDKKRREISVDDQSDEVEDEDEAEDADELRKEFERDFPGEPLPYWLEDDFIPKTVIYQKPETPPKRVVRRQIKWVEANGYALGTIHDVFSDDSYDEDDLLGEKEDVPVTYDEDYLLSNANDPAPESDGIEGIVDKDGHADPLTGPLTISTSSPLPRPPHQSPNSDVLDNEADPVADPLSIPAASPLSSSDESVVIVEPTPENDNFKSAVEKIKEEPISPNVTILAKEGHEPSVEILPSPKVAEEVLANPEIHVAPVDVGENEVHEESEAAVGSESLVAPEDPIASEVIKASGVSVENINKRPISPDVLLLAPEVHEPSVVATSEPDLSLASPEISQEVPEALLESGDDVAVTYDEDYLLSDDHEPTAISDALVENRDVQSEVPIASNDQAALNTTTSPETDVPEIPAPPKDSAVPVDLIEQETVDEPQVAASPDALVASETDDVSKVPVTSEVPTGPEDHVASEPTSNLEIEAVKECTAPEAIPDPELTSAPEVPVKPVVSAAPEVPAAPVVPTISPQNSIESTQQTSHIESDASLTMDAVSVPNEEPIAAAPQPSRPVREVHVGQKTPGTEPDAEPVTEPEPEVTLTSVKEPPAKKAKTAVSDNEESEATITKRVLRSAVNKTPTKKNKGRRAKKTLNAPKARIQPRRGAKQEDATDEPVQDVEPEKEEETEEPHVEEQHVEKAPEPEPQGDYGSIGEFEDDIPIGDDVVHAVHNEEDLLAEPTGNAEDQLHNMEPEQQFTVEQLLGEDVPVEEPHPEPAVRVEDQIEQVEEAVEQEPVVVEPVVEKRKRGRPKKVKRGAKKKETVVDKEPEEGPAPEEASKEAVPEEETPETPTKRVLRKRGADVMLPSTESAKGAKKKKTMAAEEPEEGPAPVEASKAAVSEEEAPETPTKRVLRKRGADATLPSTSAENARGAKKNKKQVVAEEPEEEQAQETEEAAEVPTKRVLQQKGLETTLLSTEAENATRKKRIYLSKNNPAPRVRATEMKDEVVRVPVRLTGVAGAYSESSESSPEIDPFAILGFPAEPAEPAQKKNPQPVEEQEEREIKEEEPDEVWVMPAPVTETSRKSKKRLRKEALEKDIKQEDGNAPVDPECEIVMSTIAKMKQEQDEEMEDCMIVQANYRCQPRHVAVNEEAEIALPKVIEHPGEGIKHLHLVLKRTWTGINELFMSDPAKFSAFSLILSKDSDKKGRVFKTNASVEDRTSEFSAEFIEYLANSPRFLSAENEPLTAYNAFSEALRNRTSILLANHKITPLKLHKVVEKITAIKKALRDTCRTMGQDERDATAATEAILLGRYIDSIMKLTALSQLSWATEVHVKRRLELIYHGWEMFLASGGFFKVMLALKRDDVKPLSDKFRTYSEEYLKDIEANYAKAVELYKMTDEELFEKLRTKARVTESQVAAADADVRGEKSETHKEKCLRCSDTPIYFSSFNNIQTHYKFHEIDQQECGNCYEDFIEPELVMHRINTHFGLRLSDD